MDNTKNAVAAEGNAPRDYAAELDARINAKRDERIAHGLPKSDAEILKWHDDAVMRRALMELRIVRRVVRDLKAAGYDLFLDVADNEPPMEINTKTEKIAELFQLDDAVVFVHKGQRSAGWVRFVFGNDGYDVVCDYTTNLEEDLKGASELADKIEMGA